ncbi:E3 ubiquitin-protein ligase RNF19A-like isoform 2-T2 [Pholidichthys leucotaenia]
MSLQKHQQLSHGGGVMGSDRDLQSTASSISLPSVMKAPKKRRFSLASLFRRRGRESKSGHNRSRELQHPGPGVLGGIDGIASIESIHSEMCNDKNSAVFSVAGTGAASAAAAAAAAAASTSSASGPCFSTPSSKVRGAVGVELLECPLCLLRHSRENFPDIMTCQHRSCIDCLRQYLRIEISESRVNISCPECTERFNPHDIRTILADPALMDKYEEFMLRRWLAADPDCRWCPAPDCGYAVIAFGCASCPKITCGRESCGTEFCYHCKQLWHPNQTCDAARQQRSQSLHLRTVRSSSLSYSQESGPAADDIKPCPRCAAYIIKMNDGSCNHMTCAVCGCEFCWLCMKEISDLHYLSPSGCTFWGKKPWSRKKKILWQLGTLVGAPVGIALIAGIAIPAMIIGIPVYVGRKIHNRYEGKDISNHKRNLVIAGGVTLSVIVSPVVAAVTVDTTSVADTRNNPSIDEGSVGGLTGSLSTSGSHMDRLGAIRDNLSETASTMALAGASITGSLSGSAMVNYLNRLEVQADIQKERCSLSGESGTVSLGTISDNASTKAMAGSILNAYMPLDRDGNSMEVQVDIESKPGKLRHCSGSSSVDDGSHVGRCGWICPSNPCTSSEGNGTSTKWAKEASCSSNSGGKKSKGKLRKKGGGGTKINEMREDMDAQLLEQRSINSSEFDSPSLSGSLPSVADSHSSHFSEFSCSDLESMKTSCSHGSNGGDYQTRFATISPLPEVENDRLETCPAPSSSQGQGAVITSHSPTSSSLGHPPELSSLCFITEESVNLVCPAESDSQPNSGEALKETNNNHQPQHPAQPNNCCIQTDI